MALLPVWLEHWQLACCGTAHVAETEKPWSESLTIEIEHAAHASGESPVQWHAVGDGFIEFAGIGASVSEEGFKGVLLDLGDVWAFAPSRQEEGRITGRGRLVADWHELGNAGLIRSRLICSGIVRRVIARKLIIEQESRVRRRVLGYEPGQEVRSTADLVDVRDTDVLLDVEIESSAEDRA